MRATMRLSCLTLLTLFLIGCGTPSLLITPVSGTRALQEQTVEPGQGWFPDKIAIIDVEGMLINAQTGGFLRPQENKVSLFLEQLNAAASDKSVKAVVLRINSPGGTVAASDTMYQMLMDFRSKTHKPVVASAQDVTASGAYYVACASDKIVVQPTSVIGSIGVIFNTLDISTGLSKLGITTEAIKSGQFKDIGSPFKHMTPQEREIMQGIVDQFFHRFVGVVTTHRTIKQADLAMATDGRVFTGENAMTIGLADQIGSLSDAINLARRLAHAPDAKTILYKRPYGYSGTIYSTTSTPTPQSNILRVEIPGLSESLPAGFYYLWQP